MGYSQDEVDYRASMEKPPGIYLKTHWCGNIERCISRDVSTQERVLLAKILKQPETKYLDLETDPRKVIGSLQRKQTVKSYARVIERSIEFPPEYKQAGVSILSYFSRVVDSKYPEDDVRVSILQEGNKVTLRVETPDGEVEDIDRTLDEYGMVVNGQLPVAQFTGDQELIRDLKTRLEVTRLELKLRQEAFLEGKEQYGQRIQSLESQVDTLTGLVTQGLGQAGTLLSVLQATIAHGDVSRAIADSLARIADLAESEYSDDNAAEMEAEFETIRNESPTVYKRVVDQMASIPARVMANMATPWVQEMLANLPR